METKYPALRRPKRKLCYLTNNESSSKQWPGLLTLGDIDGMFDDLDSSSHGNDDLPPPSSLHQTFDTERNQLGHLTKPPRSQMGPIGDKLHPALRSSSRKLDTDLDIPFKAHMPVKTSSPIEEKMIVEELNHEKDVVMSPVLFACEDEGIEEEKTEPPHVTEHDDSELVSPPRNIVFNKPKMSSHKKKVEESCKESHQLTKKTPKKTQTAVLEGKRTTKRQENTDPPESAVTREPELAGPEKKSENVHRQPSVESTRVVMATFLKKLRDAGQPKPLCSRKSLSPVKVPTPPPPEPDDDFLILEDDRTLWFSIPTKTATGKKQRLSRTSSTDKDGSTDKGTNDSPLETAQKRQEPEHTKSKLGSQTVHQKTKKMRGKEKKNEVTEPGNDEGELSSPEELPAGNLMEEEKPNKKKRPKKVPSKKSDTEEEHAKDRASWETCEEKPTPKMEKKTHTKTSKSLKDGNENDKTSWSLKKGRKVTQGSETMCVEAEKGQSRSSEEKAEAAHLDSLSNKEIMNCEAQTEEDSSERSSPADGHILGRRKPPGWVKHPITEAAKVRDNQPTLKKSKPHNQKPSAAVLSPVKDKKGRVLKKINQTQPAPSSSRNTNKAEEKKRIQNKNGNTRGDTAGKVFHTFDAEPFEEQEAADQDVQSSPLVLSHRDLSHNSGEQVFQRVYHNVSITRAPAGPTAPREQLRAAEPDRRRRKAPGSWWTVNDMYENTESISSPPQQQEPKPHQERKPRSKRRRSPRLGTPKNGNMAVSSKPLGGAPVPLPKLRPLSTRKTVKRSLAPSTDTSVTETTNVGSTETGQKSRRKVTSRPAEEVIATDCTVFSKTDKDILSVDAGECRSTQDSLPHHETPQDSKCQSEDRLKHFRSGPSSMIELQEYEENDSLILPPPRVHAALGVSDLCAPPLKPLVLQPKDKANLTEWFKSLWSIPVKAESAEVTPEQFDWYFYQGRAIGFLVDLNCGSFCNGKILLGSYMKKPLWVDHSATTVFNLLTSSVSVTIDGKESRSNPGQSFMVPCGRAYSIQNVTAQPAVLYFTRIQAESSD
ncbi:proteoglycan 4 isoform X2 [Cottoperca gobio]|uniref:Proteoglycan 4 isoform X2 n=1 Tax=Cottoperca gobio TaxID=56716 RepID=A0A6J2RT90_COTGO|nr:proteoglycan 4-like isoform X2 [Cottoperca gobio]